MSLWLVKAFRADIQTRPMGTDDGSLMISGPLCDSNQIKLLQRKPNVNKKKQLRRNRGQSQSRPSYVPRVR